VSDNWSKDHEVKNIAKLVSCEPFGDFFDVPDTSDLILVCGYFGNGGVVPMFIGLVGHAYKDRIDEAVLELEKKYGKLRAVVTFPLNNADRHWLMASDAELRAQGIRQ